MAEIGDSGSLENPGPNKKKAMSSNLLNLKVRNSISRSWLTFLSLCNEAAMQKSLQNYSNNR